ncbi:twin-arginine translocase subunit TatC [Hydrogenoanaerobacterium sp.]|uniref:twin-arginine translocase subunit TatC n=1 Tax=Hydrogenoanaerobacterium sp. TaxID=2953763 RepID=UPI002897FB68|nr:twin-arginine translocase subunit TatC [Hydrogenoanaerobacterium sp.]
MRKKNEMPLLDHLGELRRRLVIVVVTNVVAAMIIFGYAGVVMEYLLAINPGMQLVYISPSELFLIYMNISFLAAFVVCSPITIYQVWAFVEKGLYKREKIYVLFSLLFGLICFAGGVYFCYRMVLPVTLQFFTRIAISEVKAMISVKSYTSFVNVMLLSFGLVFEMPVIVFMLTKLEILKPKFLKQYKGVMIIIIFIVAAIVTPPDVISQLMLAIPMVILLYLSILISVVVDKMNTKRHKKEELEQVA